MNPARIIYPPFRQVHAPLELRSRVIVPANHQPTPDMPLLTAAISLPVMFICAMIPVAGVVVAAAPASGDIAAVLGALLASALAILEAYHRKKELHEKVKAFLGAAIVGSFAPGLLVNIGTLIGWYSHEAVNNIWWQFWAFGGLICGINGWWIINAASRAGRKKAVTFLGVDGNDDSNQTPKP